MSSERLDFALAFLNLPDLDAEAVFQVARRAGAGRLSRDLAESLVAGAPFDTLEDVMGLRGITENTLKGIAEGLIARGFRLGAPFPADLGRRLVTPIGDRPDVPVPDELLQRKPPTTCGGLFVSSRQTPLFYKKFSTVKVGKGRIKFGAIVACKAPKTVPVPKSVSIPIFWTVLSSTWSRQQAQKKIAEARRWFAQYCISLTLYEVNFNPDDPAALTKQLNEANDAGIDDYAKKVKEIYRKIWDGRLGRPSQFLLVLFVDKFEGRFKEVGRTLTVNVALNVPKLPVILIPEKEIKSTHVLTHELLHGLGKQQWKRSGNIVTTTPFGDSAPRDNAWSEGGCANEMGNSQREDPGKPLLKRLAAPMDWATYYQFWRSNTIRF
jgi:hypothetical protein